MQRRVDRILNGFNKTVAKLEKVSADAVTKSLRNTSIIIELENEIDALTKTRDHADHVAKNIKNLLGV